MSLLDDAGIARIQAIPGMLAALTRAADLEIPKTLDLLSTAIQNRDPRRIIFGAHKLKGTAGTLGMQDLAKFAEDIEAAARAGALGLLPPLVYHLNRCAAESLAAFKALKPKEI